MGEVRRETGGPEKIIHEGRICRVGPGGRDTTLAIKKFQIKTIFFFTYLCLLV